jgi:hypothetical protein
MKGGKKKDKLILLLLEVKGKKERKRVRETGKGGEESPH